MKQQILVAIVSTIYIGLGSTYANAITIVDNFTGSSANSENNWATPIAPNGVNKKNDACLTAGNGNSKSAGGIPSCESVFGNSSYNQTVGNGALLLTVPQNSQEGAIVSQTPFNTSQGITVTFNTYTFGGYQSGGGGPTNLFNAAEYGITPINPAINTVTGADGIGFYLIDATNQLVENSNDTLASTFSIGANGGSLAYQCSNTNYPFNGMPGAYLGLGIDEWGNFVNPGDNTDSGPGFAPNSIALRGYGNVNKNSILQTIVNAGHTTPSDFNASVVQNVCKNGGMFSYSNGNFSYGSNHDTYTLPDYQYINGSFAQLPANQLISDATATTRSAATPMSYKLTITPTGLLSFSYSYNNGAYQQIPS